MNEICREKGRKTNIYLNKVQKLGEQSGRFKSDTQKKKNEGLVRQAKQSEENDKFVLVLEIQGGKNEINEAKG